LLAQQKASGHFTLDDAAVRKSCLLLGQRSDDDAVDGNLVSYARLAAIGFELVASYQVPDLRAGILFLPLMSSLLNAFWHYLASSILAIPLPSAAFVYRAHDIGQTQTGSQRRRLKIASLSFLSFWPRSPTDSVGWGVTSMIYHSGCEKGKGQLVNSGNHSPLFLHREAPPLFHREIVSSSFLLPTPAVLFVKMPSSLLRDDSRGAGHSLPFRSKMASLNRQACPRKIRPWFPRQEHWSPPVLQVSLDVASILTGLCLVSIISNAMDDNGEGDPGDLGDPTLPSRYVSPRPRPNAVLLLSVLIFPGRQLLDLPRVPFNPPIAREPNVEIISTIRATSGTAQQQELLLIANAGPQSPRAGPRSSGNAFKESQQTLLRQIPRAIKTWITHLERWIILYQNQTSRSSLIPAPRWLRTATHQLLLPHPSFSLETLIFGTNSNPLSLSTQIYLTTAIILTVTYTLGVRATASLMSRCTYHMPDGTVLPLITRQH